MKIFRNVSLTAREQSSLGISACMLILVVSVHRGLATPVGFPYLIGDRSDAIFDLWSVQHFFSGVLIGTILLLVAKTRFKSVVEFCCAVFWIALVWEALELSMECGLLGEAVSHWKRGFEHWGNRFIGDPLMGLIGALCARRFKYAWIFVILPATAWLILNVLSPHSMMIQEKIFGH